MVDEAGVNAELFIDIVVLYQFFTSVYTFFNNQSFTTLATNCLATNLLSCVIGLNGSNYHPLHGLDQ